jgi:hypothetical protein
MNLRTWKHGRNDANVRLETLRTAWQEAVALRIAESEFFSPLMLGGPSVDFLRMHRE